MAKALPFVSVIMPVRNEERYIARCLRSLFHGGYPDDRWEIIIADGMSGDNTRVAIAQVAGASPVPITVLENVRRVIPVALNMAITHARGEVIIRVDAHSEYPPDYLIKCVRALREHGAANVGGPVTTLPGADTPIARAIALVMSHPFGVGNSTFRTQSYACEVDTVPFGCVPRKVYRQVGLFDERLHRNEDYQFNRRIVQAGGRIFLDPRLQSVYRSRATLGGLLTQAWNNGFWNAMTHYLHPDSICARHAVPMVFSLGMTLALALAIWEWTMRIPRILQPLAIAVWVCCGAYALVNALVATQLAVRREAALWPVLLVTFPLFHFVYGAGIVWGWICAMLHIFPWRRDDGIPQLDEHRAHPIESV